MQTHEPYFVPHVEVVISDYTLPLSVVEKFSAHYGPSTGGDVRIVSRLGGPAAGGPGWGGPEIAVAIVVGEMLRRSASDAYDLVRQFIVDAYTKIKTRTGARLYIDGAMALGVDSESKALRVLFCFPEGLQGDELNRRIRLVEQHWPAVLEEFERDAPPLGGGLPNRAEVKVCWDARQEAWRECQPRPDDA
jgi:hypothetical protein